MRTPPRPRAATPTEVAILPRTIEVVARRTKAAGQTEPLPAGEPIGRAANPGCGHSPPEAGRRARRPAFLSDALRIAKTVRLKRDGAAEAPSSIAYLAAGTPLVTFFDCENLSEAADYGRAVPPDQCQRSCSEQSPGPTAETRRSFREPPACSTPPASTGIAASAKSGEQPAYSRLTANQSRGRRAAAAASSSAGSSDLSGPRRAPDDKFGASGRSA